MIINREIQFYYKLWRTTLTRVVNYVQRTIKFEKNYNDKNNRFKFFPLF